MFEPFYCPGKHAGTRKLFPLARMAEKLGNVPIHLNSLTTEKQTTNFSSANSVDLDEVAHYEPPHQDLRCLQIQLFSSLVVKELKLALLQVTMKFT